MFLGKNVLKICSKFRGGQLCQSAILLELLRNFIEIALWHGCSPVNLLHIFRTPFLKNTSGRLLLILIFCLYFRIFQPRVMLSLCSQLRNFSLYMLTKVMLVKKRVYFYLEEFSCNKKEDEFINILSHMQYQKNTFRITLM